MICSDDTDVFIMCLAFHDKIGSPLFHKCGTETRTRVVDIRKVAATVGIDVCRAVIGIHAYTVCDTTSAFAGMGKASALKFLTNNREIKNTFLGVGSWMGTLPRTDEQTRGFYMPGAGPTSANTCWQRVEDWDWKRSLTVGSGLDGWPASTRDRLRPYSL